MDLENMLLGAAVVEGAWYFIKFNSVMGPDFPDHPNPGTENYKKFNRLVFLPAPLDILYLGYEIAKYYLKKENTVTD